VETIARGGCKRRPPEGKKGALFSFSLETEEGEGEGLKEG